MGLIALYASALFARGGSDKEAAKIVCMTSTVSWLVSMGTFYITVPVAIMSPLVATTIVTHTSTVTATAVTTATSTAKGFAALANGGSEGYHGIGSTALTCLSCRYVRLQH